MELEAERARGRQVELAGTRPHTDLKENFPEGSGGQARDLAAEKVGWSGKTAERAAKVVDFQPQIITG